MNGWFSVRAWNHQRLFVVTGAASEVVGVDSGGALY
jgi:hypothetical protein